MKVHVSCAICGYSKETTFRTRATTGGREDPRVLGRREKTPEVVFCYQCLGAI